jgi:hypothetical protein
MATLTVKQKNILDRVLWAAGAILGFIAANVTSIAGTLPANEQVVATTVLTAVGVLGGDVVSDLIGLVDTGALPPAAAAQTWADAKALIASQIAKLPAADQPLASAALATIDAEIAKLLPAGAPAA